MIIKVIVKITRIAPSQIITLFTSIHITTRNTRTGILIKTLKALITVSRRVAGSTSSHD